MIGRLRGELIEIDVGMAVIDCGGVGYEVAVPESVLASLPSPGERVELVTRQVFREDGVSLYGFMETFQRRLFDLLMDVKGCGPKIGLSLIGQLGVDAVVGAITTQDARSLARATGVGPRLAERIILELREKVHELSLHRKIEASVGSRTQPHRGSSELVDALLALGYRRSEAELAAQSAEGQAEGVEDQLRLALRSLQR